MIVFGYEAVTVKPPVEKKVETVEQAKVFLEKLEPIIHFLPELKISPQPELKKEEVKTEETSIVILEKVQIPKLFIPQNLFDSIVYFKQDQDLEKSLEMFKKVLDEQSETSNLYINALYKYNLIKHMIDHSVKITHESIETTLITAQRLKELLSMTENQLYSITIKSEIFDAPEKKDEFKIAKILYNKIQYDKSTSKTKTLKKEEIKVEEILAGLSKINIAEELKKEEIHLPKPKIDEVVEKFVKKIFSPETIAALEKLARKEQKKEIIENIKAIKIQKEQETISELKIIKGSIEEEESIQESLISDVKKTIYDIDLKYPTIKVIEDIEIPMLTPIEKFFEYRDQIQESIDLLQKEKKALEAQNKEKKNKEEEKEIKKLKTYQEVIDFNKKQILLEKEKIKDIKLEINQLKDKQEIIKIKIRGFKKQIKTEKLKFTKEEAILKDEIWNSLEKSKKRLAQIKELQQNKELIFIKSKKNAYYKK